MIARVAAWLLQLITPILLKEFKEWFLDWRARRAARAAVDKSTQTGDQRDVEKYIGSTKAGEPSGLPGTSIRDSIPGVPGSGMPDKK